MAIKFFNVKSKETRVVGMDPITAEAQIAAFYNSSDRNINAQQGQDMGWRLAPEVVAWMREIAQDEDVLQRIATRMRKSVEELGESDILLYISSKTLDPNLAPAASDSDFSTEYLAQVAEAERAREASRIQIDPGEDTSNLNLNPNNVTTTTTESLADMEKRAELAERIAKANAAAAAATEGSNTTTTTTEVAPTTTTTTIKK